jgi:hypothetical protein
MRSRIGYIALLITGAIVVVFTLAAFFLLDIEKTTINRWALAFLLLSEFVLFGGLIGLCFTSVGHAKLFLRAGVSSALSLYFIATLISIFLVRILRDNLNVFILVQLAVIAFFAIVIVCVLAFSRVIAHRNEADISKVGTNEPKRGGF